MRLGPDAAAETVTGLDHCASQTREAQFARGDQPGDPPTDDDDVSLGHRNARWVSGVMQP